MNAPPSSDEKLAEELSMRCAEARKLLASKMEERGLVPRNGWRITEATRTVIGGIEIVMRPLHLSLPSPPDLQCIVHIDTDCTSIRTEVHCDDGGRVAPRDVEAD
jgi:hypothetical protein